MKVIKEVYSNPLSSYFVVVLRRATGDSSLQHVKVLEETAKADFPGLEDKDINIRLFSAPRIQGQMGITFLINRSNGEIPADYKDIPFVEASY
jgi:hypothetical protein